MFIEYNKTGHIHKDNTRGDLAIEVAQMNNLDKYIKNRKGEQ